MIKKIQISIFLILIFLIPKNIGAEVVETIKHGDRVYFSSSTQARINGYATGLGNIYWSALYNNQDVANSSIILLFLLLCLI